MAEQLARKPESDKSRLEKQESLTINDPPFNVRYQPSEVFSPDTKDTKSIIRQKFDDTTSALSQSVDFSMQSLLKQALWSFENFMDPKLPIEQRIPLQVLNEAKGIMFLSVVKGGVGFGGMLGTGIIMARNPNWRTEWTAPCAFGIGGLQIGFNIGIEKTDHVIFIRDENVITKFHSGLRLGGDISLSVGPLGRDANIGITVNEQGVIPNVSYSMSKGAYIGFALEGSVITIRNDCNEQYFGQKCDVLQILNGSVKAPFDDNFTSLSRTLECYFKPHSDDKSLDCHTATKDENHPILNITSDTKNP